MSLLGVSCPVTGRQARSALRIGQPEAVEVVLTAYRNTLQANAPELVGLSPNARWPGGRLEDTRSVYGDDRMFALALESPYPVASLTHAARS